MARTIAFMLAGLVTVAQAADFQGLGNIVVRELIGIQSWGSLLGCLDDAMKFTSDDSNCGVFNGTLEAVPPDPSCTQYPEQYCPTLYYWHLSTDLGECGFGSTEFATSCGGNPGETRLSTFSQAGWDPYRTALATLGGNGAYQFTTPNGGFPTNGTSLVQKPGAPAPELVMTWNAI